MSEVADLREAGVRRLAADVWQLTLEQKRLERTAAELETLVAVVEGKVEPPARPRLRLVR
jgi:hypothetical protein